MCGMCDNVYYGLDLWKIRFFKLYYLLPFRLKAKIRRVEILFVQTRKADR